MSQSGLESVSSSMIEDAVILDQSLTEKYEKTLNGSILTRLDGANYWIEKGHEFYKKNNYRRALHYYDKARRYLNNVQIERPFLDTFGKYQDRALDLIRTAWIWMGIAYQELHEKARASKCFQTEIFYAEKQLALLEKRKEIKNKKILDIKLIIAMWLFVSAGIVITTHFFRAQIQFVNFLFFLLILSSYILFFIKYYVLKVDNTGVKNKSSKNYKASLASFSFFVLIIIIAIIITHNFFYTFTTGNYISPTWQLHSTTIFFSASYIPLFMLATIIHYLYHHKKYPSELDFFT